MIADILSLFEKHSGKLLSLTDGTYDFRVMINWVSKSVLTPSSWERPVILANLEVTNRSKQACQISKVFLKSGDQSILSSSFELNERRQSSDQTPLIKVYLPDIDRSANIRVPSFDVERMKSTYLQSFESTTGTVLFEIPENLIDKTNFSIALQIGGYPDIFEADL